MTRFEQVFVSVLIAHHNKFPNRYVKSLERTIELELSSLRSGLSRKDSDVIIDTCLIYGIDNSYKEIKEALNEQV